MAAIGVTTQGGATAVGTPGSLATLTPAQIQKILVEPLQAKSVFLSMGGIRFFDTNGAPVRIPKNAPPTAPGFVGENTQIPENEFAYDEVLLLPSTMKSVKTLTRFSNELARQFVVSLDSAIQGRLVTDVAAAIDKALIASTVTNGTEPTGLLSYPGVQVFASAGAITVDTLYDCEEMLIAANADPANFRWIFRSNTWRNIRKLKASGTGNFLVAPDVSQSSGLGKTLLGYPVTLTNRIPQTTTTQAMLLDTTQVAVARDLTPSVTILRERYADYDQQAIRTVARYDAGPLNAQAIVRLDGVIP